MKKPSRFTPEHKVLIGGKSPASLEKHGFAGLTFKRADFILLANRRSPKRLL
jgi:hypothetical protein